MLLPGKIPTYDAITTLIRPLIENRCGLSNIIGTNSWGRQSRTQTHCFYYKNIFPNRFIKITKQDRIAAQEYCTINELPYYQDHHVMDEFFHWADNYDTLEDDQDLHQEDFKQIIIPRIKHPIIVFSIVTQNYVQNYKRKYGLKETKLLLKQSCARWVLTETEAYTKRKWSQQKEQLQEFDLWPIQTLVQHIINRYSLNQPTPTARTTTFLKGYTEKATDSFQFKYGKVPAYKIALGVELELENMQQEDSHVLTATLGDHAIFKRDGSLTNGVEICTAPATLDLHKEKFKEFFTKNKNLTAESTCGLHVHVDRKKLFKTQIPKIDMFLNKASNNPLIEKIAGRQANHYCNTREKDWTTSILTKNHNRYARLNLIPDQTIEFRLFASTTDYKQFCRCLEFVQAIVDYTKPGEHDCSIKEVVDQNNFLAYVKKNHHFYPTLHKFIEETL